MARWFKNRPFSYGSELKYNIKLQKLKLKANSHDKAPTLTWLDGSGLRQQELGLVFIQESDKDQQILFTY